MNLPMFQVRARDYTIHPEDTQKRNFRSYFPLQSTFIGHSDQFDDSAGAVKIITAKQDRYIAG